MKTKTHLQTKVKRPFDIDNETDVELFKQYLENSGWGVDGCPFLLEFPFLNIPDMIKAQIVYKFLGLPV